ncbi:MAG TPA: hypothetical protein VGN72_21960 [Tepidisphaeraceae bacterium]|jgi:hypothetical protein|nr:hypothetical protein [Tepidisphaeraceae bacterium]
MRIASILIVLCLTASLSAQTIYRDRVDQPRDQSDRAGAVMRAQQNQAKSQMESARLRVVKTFEASEDWQKAQQELQQAQAAYDEASKPVLDALKEKPEYKESKKAEEEARAAVQAAHKEGDPSPAEVTAPATEALEAGSEVTKMEQAALDADPKVAELKAKRDEIAARLQALQQQRDAAILADPEWQAAKKLHDEAAVNAAQSY